MNHGAVFAIIGIIWSLSEIILGLVTRVKRSSATTRDRGSHALLWICISAGIGGGIILRTVRAAAIAIPILRLQAMGLVLVAGGLTLRWAAIITLGRFFTAAVAIHRDHLVVKKGVYRRIRHPSYSGALLAFLGVALSFGNWLSLGVIMIPIAVAFVYRIHVEENALVEALGEEYTDYCRTTKRLIPGLY